MRRTSFVWPLLFLFCLLMVIPAAGENASYTFLQNGLRVYLPNTWQVLTASNLSEKEDTIKQLGTTMEALLASFQNAGALLEAYPPEGGQFLVTCQPVPSDVQAQDAYSMTQEQKDDFLLKMARAGGFAHGTWSADLPEFAVFQGSTSLQSLQVQTIAYVTIRYGNVYTATEQIIGREPTAQDEAALKTLAASLLFLGAQVTPAPAATAAPQATLNLVPTPTPAPAEIRVQRDEAYLAVDDVPSVSHTTELTVTGVTEPGISMRYYVNGQGYERFTADSEGRFSCLIRSLPNIGKNIITIHAIGEKGYGVVAFTVVLDQEKAPLAVTPFTQGIAGNTAVITGAALPGSTVQVLYRREVYDALVQADGSFTAEVRLPKLGENTFTVRATLPGYIRSEEKLTILRIKSSADEQESFIKTLKTVSYDKLMAKPEKYKDVHVKYQGMVVALSGQGGQPLAVIATEAGTCPVALLADQLIGLELNQSVTVLCALTGAQREVRLPDATALVPEARLYWLLPNE